MRYAWLRHLDTQQAVHGLQAQVETCPDDAALSFSTL
jgi:hypothetical protein